jgi:hypothetical protein
MNLPTDLPHLPGSVGAESGDGELSRGGAAVLNFAVEWMRFCPVCQKQTRFIGQIELENGLLGICASCGDERVAPYTRMVSE